MDPIYYQRYSRRLFVPAPVADAPPVPRRPYCPRLAPPSGYRDLWTSPPITVVVANDLEAHQPIYRIDGERCWDALPGVEARANQALFEGVHALLDGCWICVGYLAIPHTQRTPEEDEIVRGHVLGRIHLAEGRPL